jgi:hypothetical protein
MEKKCKKCNVVKDVSEFYKLKSSKDGFSNECRVCCKEYREANKEKAKQNRINRKNPTLQELEAEAEKKRLFENEKKKCKKCNVVKDVSEFNKGKTSKDGLRGYCKVCISEQKKEYREANKEKIAKYNKKYIEANKEKVAKYNANRRKLYKPNLQIIKAKEEKKRLFEDGKKQCSKCNVVKDVSDFGNQKDAKDKLKSHCRSCRMNNNRDNKEKIFQYNQKYYDDNKESIVSNNAKYTKSRMKTDSLFRERLADYKKKYMKGYMNEYKKTRIKTDSLFKLTINTRRAVTRYLRDGKNKRTKEIIGIDYKEFQDYLEVEYTDDMHLDHIIPLSWANNDEEVYTLNHYSNFQIITAEENLAKKDTYCKSENLKKVLDNHNNLTKLNQIIERNSDKIK